MSESEDEESYCFYGKPLEPYNEDAFPKKRPISVEEQVATDSHGRRRFHGAFTGGFSAGFFNSVGSLEGWAPTDFKSSRQDKASSKKQKPQDFMDDEDVGEFGFAPETVRATKDFSTSSKRKRQEYLHNIRLVRDCFLHLDEQVYSSTDGPIPGEPVLQTLIGSGDETVGYLLLKNIGFEDKKKIKEQMSTGEKTYGCQMPSSYELDTISSVLEEDSYKIPDIYKTFLAKPKNDTFGMGYSGLDKSHLNLFKSTNFVVHDKNKKLSIAGQAFGVGAFEEEDDDIYAKEDMSRYDFEITKEKERTAKAKQVETKVLDMFVLSKTSTQKSVSFPLPSIPHSFTGKHKVRKSRFEPVYEKEEEEVIVRSTINPIIRAKYLGEEINQNSTSSREMKSFALSNDQPTSSKPQEVPTEDTDAEDPSGSEVKKPLFNADLLFDKFVSASQTDDHTNMLEPVKPSVTDHGTQEMRDAAHMKMFGPLTRLSLNWRPCALLCKRFNVPEPNFDGTSSMKNRKRTKHLIFQYQRHDESEPKLTPGLCVQKQEPISETTGSETNTNQITSDCISTMDVADTSTIKTEAPDTPCRTEEIMNMVAESEPSSSGIEETPKELTDKLGIEKNIDLFKAVFLSSSESDEDETQEEAPTNEVTEEMKNNILSDEFIPKIKPAKQGILSNIGHIKFTKPAATTSEDDTSKQDTPENNMKDSTEDYSLYGPKIPEKICFEIKKETTHVKSSSSEDEWVEMGKEDKKKKKKKHKKKHKKEKKRHKKDKKTKR